MTRFESVIQFLLTALHEKKNKKSSKKNELLIGTLYVYLFFFVFSLGQIVQILFNFREEAYQREVRGPRKFLVSVEEVDISGYKNGLPKILAKGNWK